MRLVPVTPEYVYVTIPAEYICVYHRILAMMADFGEAMLKDCKASCTDKNSNVIECFNMFNAAVAAKKLGKDKLAETLIKYIKAKINQIYHERDNSTSFIFPIDETGQIKAFVSCEGSPKFEINEKDMNLYVHKFDDVFDEHFKLGPEDESPDDSSPVEENDLVVTFTPRYELDDNGEWVPCGDLNITCNDLAINPKKCIVNYYFDENQVNRFDDIKLDRSDIGNHTFEVVVIYKGITKVVDEILEFNPFRL